MGRIDIRPQGDWDTMTHEEKLAWAQGVVNGTRAAYEAEDEPLVRCDAPGAIR